jgi:pyrimidine operon attenuation protein/uracil phosphoribosyltransferase
VAEHLHRALNLSNTIGVLDISFYRDDFSRLGLNPQVKPSQLPLDITDQNIILVDDILHTGRTIRAAMNELFDYGRPASVSLAVLIDRGGRELPISAQMVGDAVELPAHQHVKLTGPEPLALEIITTD